MTDGSNILYHYIQKHIIQNNDEDAFARELTERFIIDLSIWMPREVYEQLPVLLPFVVRDPKCRNKNPDLDTWGQSNLDGFLKDDNSLIKGIIKPFVVRSKKIKEYHGKKLAKGFTACHIWRNLVGTDVLASQCEQTNSFVPNLVWLPTQIGKLTDREGSYAQKLVQTISYKLYFEGRKSSALQDKIWGMLENPALSPSTNIDIEKLNFFDVPSIWLDKKKKSLLNDISQIESAIANGEVDNKVKSSKYLPTLLTHASDESHRKLRQWLDDNRKHVDSF